MYFLIFLTLTIFDSLSVLLITFHELLYFNVIRYTKYYGILIIAEFCLLTTESANGLLLYLTIYDIPFTTYYLLSPPPHNPNQSYQVNSSCQVAHCPETSRQGYDNRRNRSQDGTEIIGCPYPGNHIFPSFRHNADSQGEGHAHQEGQRRNQAGGEQKPDGNRKGQGMLKNQRNQVLVDNQ